MHGYQVLLAVRDVFLCNVVHALTMGVCDFQVLRELFPLDHVVEVVRVFLQGVGMTGAATCDEPKEDERHDLLYSFQHC